MRMRGVAVGGVTMRDVAVVMTMRVIVPIARRLGLRHAGGVGMCSFCDGHDETIGLQAAWRKPPAVANQPLPACPATP